MPEATRPKNIQIYLPYGNPRGIRLADLTSRTIQAIQIPRKQLKKSTERPEVSRVGVYFLFDQAGEESKPRVYIGEAEDAYRRLYKHNRNRDFWNTAVVVVSKTESFTKAHARFLEWRSIQRANEVDRFQLENSTSPKLPSTPEPMEAELLDNFEAMKILLATLGFPLLEELRDQARDSEDLLYCEGKGAEGKGLYVEDGFLVLVGSKARKDVVPSMKGKSKDRLRQELIEDGVMEEDGDHYVFQEDHLLSSPSTASSVLLGTHSNGWDYWKDKNGRSLDELERQ